MQAASELNAKANTPGIPMRLMRQSENDLQGLRQAQPAASSVAAIPTWSGNEPATVGFLLSIALLIQRPSWSLVAN